MLNVRNILVALLCASPLLLLWDGLIAQALVTGIAAIALAMAAMSLRPVETNFLVFVTRLPLLAAAVPALWVLLQILPLGIFAHPIWKSAATALHQPIVGSISIDPAVSIISLGHYLSFVAVAFLSAAVAVDRHRAEWVLLALSIAATITSLFVMARHFFSFAPAFNLGQAIDCVSLGTIVTATNCIRAVERYQTRSPKQTKLATLRLFTASFAALVICVVAFVLLAGKQAVFAAGYGLLLLVCQSIIRRFGLGLWGAAGMAIPALLIAAIVVSSHAPQRDTSALLAFANDSPPALTELNERMLDDAPLVGTGAGTFAALTAIYREKDDPQSATIPATTAAALAIELGKPMLWLIVAGTATFIVFLLWASSQRWRDSFYSAMAASSLLTLALLAFSDAGLLGTSTGLIVAAILGLGVAQTESRTAHI